MTNVEKIEQLKKEIEEKKEIKRLTEELEAFEKGFIEIKMSIGKNKKLKESYGFSPSEFMRLSTKDEKEATSYILKFITSNVKNVKELIKECYIGKLENEELEKRIECLSITELILVLKQGF